MEHNPVAGVVQVGVRVVIETVIHVEQVLHGVLALYLRQHGHHHSNESL